MDTHTSFILKSYRESHVASLPASGASWALIGSVYTGSPRHGTVRGCSPACKRTILAPPSMRETATAGTVPARCRKTSKERFFPWTNSDGTRRELDDYFKWSDQKSQRERPLLVTQSTDAPASRSSARATTASKAVRNVKVHSQSSRQTLHLDGKTVMREIKNICNNTVPLHRVGSAHGLMATEPV